MKSTTYFSYIFLLLLFFLLLIPFLFIYFLFFLIYYYFLCTYVLLKDKVKKISKLQQHKLSTFKNIQKKFVLVKNKFIYLWDTKFNHYEGIIF